VLLLAPTGKDALLTQAILDRAGVASTICRDADALCRGAAAGAGCILIAEEALTPQARQTLGGCLADQPSWSDLPLLVLTSPGADSAASSAAVADLGNVTLLERPVRVRALVSAVRVALRARARQCVLRDRFQAQALLAAIVASSDDAIVSKTLDGIILSWNAGAERIFGYSAAEAIGRSITFIIPPERLDEERMILERLRQGERIEHFDTVRVSKDGRLIDVSLTISPLRDASERIVGASKVARDISERKRAEQALRDADRRKDEFLATLAHELRNPLAPLRNGIYLLPRLRDNDAAFEDNRRMMDTQLRHMVRLLDDLLDVSRVARNKIQLRKQRIELAWVVNDAVEACRPVLEERKHRLTVHCPEESVYLEGDSVRLAQVLSNLLNNAAKYTEPGGRITLAAQVFTEPGSGPQVAIRLRDNGLGISAEMLPHIFELFVQEKDHGSHAGGGLGIGLSLVKSLVELHGGHVEAHSPGLGRGSEFTVFLPILAGGTPAPPPQVQPAALEAAPRKILVVDDNQQSADSMALLLQTDGHQVRAAYDGPNALATAQEFSPDVALLDVGMPGMDGHELARLLRQLAQDRPLTLIAMTGWGREEDRQRSLAAGFDAHLVKPVKIRTITSFLAAQDRRKTSVI
jgi:PAS domain S-box-containing protein